MARHDRRSKGHDMTREKPILFSAPMVRAILDGSKSQTRRVVKLKSHHTIEERDDGKPWPWMYDGDRDADHWLPCPYGQPGDRLWVRETWGDCTKGADIMGGTKYDAPWYRADADAYGLLGHDGLGAVYSEEIKWRPSIHMPRWASRITLDITGVRVERLQDISEADAQAEGCDRLSDDEPGYVHRDDPDFNICHRCGGTRLYTAFSGSGGALPDTDCLECDTYAKRYRHLWEGINGPGSWNENPWVWAIEFRRVTP